MPEHSVLCLTCDGSLFQRQDHESFGGDCNGIQGLKQQGVSSVDGKATLGKQTPLASSLMLWVTRVLIAGLVVVALIPNLILGVVFCAGYLLAALRGRWRGWRIARASGSMPHLRRQLVPTVSSRPRRRRLQWILNTAVEKPTQGVSWSNVKPGLADQRTPLSSLTLSLIRALVAGLVLVALIPNLMLGAIFWLGAVDIPRSRSPMITANDKTIAPPVRSSDPGALIAANARSVRSRPYHLAHCARWY